MGILIWFMIGSIIYQAIFFPKIPLDINGKPVKLTKAELEELMPDWESEFVLLFFN